MRSPSTSSPVMKRVDQRPSPSAGTMPSMSVMPSLTGSGGLLDATHILDQQLSHTSIGDMSPSDISFLTNFDGLAGTIAGSGSNQIVLPPGVSLPKKKSRPTSRKPVDPNDPKAKARSKRKVEPTGEGGSGRWTKEEDIKLRSAVAAVGAKNWKRISQEFLDGRRSDVQCLHRWNKVLKPGLVKGPWTMEEDEIIRSCIQEGITKWSEIAAKVPGRIGKQCRERWFNHLDPSIKKCEWSDEEDQILIQAQGEMGNKWCEIAKMLPGRSENAVKNRWNSATRRKQQLGGAAAASIKPRKSKSTEGGKENSSNSNRRGKKTITPTAPARLGGLDESTSPSWGNLLPSDMGMGSNFGTLGGLMAVGLGGVGIDAAGLPVPPGMEVHGCSDMNSLGGSLDGLNGLSPCALPMPMPSHIKIEGFSNDQLMMPPPPPAPAPAPASGAGAGAGSKSKLHEKLLSHLFKTEPDDDDDDEKKKKKKKGSVIKQEKPSVSAEFAAQEAERLQLFSGVSFSSQEKQQILERNLVDHTQSQSQSGGVGVGVGDDDLEEVSHFDLERMFDLLPGQGKGAGKGGRGGGRAKGRGRGSAPPSVKFTVKSEQAAWGISAPPAIDIACSGSASTSTSTNSNSNSLSCSSTTSTTSTTSVTSITSPMTSLPGFTPPSASTRAAVMNMNMNVKQHGMDQLEASLDDLDIAIPPVVAGAGAAGAAGSVDMFTCAPLVA